MSPFGDALIAQSRSRFTEELELTNRRLREATPPTTSAPEGTPYVIVESGDPSAILRATKKQRPELKGWIGGAGREDIRFQDINDLKSMKFIPGGVALGQVAEVEGKWSDSGLVYDRSEGRLILIKPSGERVKFPLVSPEVLKTCFLYARSKDPVAISIGYTGERSPLERDAASRVLIHPELRDTQVGLDIINADRLPWSLDDEKLPNGRPNPILGDMKDLIKKASDPNAGMPTDELVERLKKLVDVDRKGSDPGRIETYRLSIIELLDGDTRIDYLLKAIAQTSGSAEDRFAAYTRIEDEAFSRVIRADVLKKLKDELEKVEIGKRFEVMRKVNEASLEELTTPEGLQKYREDQAKIKPFFQDLPADRIQALRSALIFLVAGSEKETAWRFAMAATLAVAASPTVGDASVRELAPQVLQLMSQAHLSLITDAPIRVKQVGAEMVFEGGLVIRYVHGKLDASTTGLSRPEKPEETPEAGQEATRQIPALEKAYPALKATREYAQYIALLRWALQDGNVGWLDLADLGPVAYRTQPTPDYIVRGSGSRVQAAMREFGLEEKSR